MTVTIAQRESIADEQQAQKSEPIYIAAFSAPTLSI